MKRAKKKAVRRVNLRRRVGPVTLRVTKRLGPGTLRAVMEQVENLKNLIEAQGAKPRQRAITRAEDRAALGVPEPALVNRANKVDMRVQILTDRVLALENFVNELVDIIDVWRNRAVGFKDRG
jgi:hypothetical protein